MSPFLHPTRLEYDVVKRLKCDCYKVDCISVLKVMSQELLWHLRFFSAFYFAGNKKKKNQLTTQLAAIGRFNHGFFCFVYLLFKLGPNYSFVCLLFNNTSGKDTSYDWTFIKRQSFLWANKTTAPTGTTM